VDCEPLALFAPLHAPDALHEVALADVQLSIALAPLAIELGLALKATVGAAALTDTVADCAALPPAPSQVNT
jgi:hypothetical protein